ncbi:transport and Golgi organization protein 11 isoform X1 [Anoplolepis gracilipes]|uniref:transport and Golgi organization protein 11 isoform X1 n=2 Tax=Anoplolepis gracilipes TaxID=354296 RepID=UPI003BA0E29A
MIIMSKTHSPTHFNGEVDNIYYPDFNADINKQMRVPKSIRVNGDYIDQDSATNTSTWNQMSNTEKLEMHVPDRILVVGQDQHVGTKAPPPEIVLENAVMRTEPAIVRVQTPPRILTLDNHYFPTVDEEEPLPHVDDEIVSPVNVRPRTYNAETQIVKHVREQTPSYNALDVSLPPSEEVQHLRRQVGKLNRRVMALELDMLHRQQRDRILYIATIAYFILKTFSWLTRN